MSDDGKPITLIFEESMPPERIAEFIEILSELYGEELDIVSVFDIPPRPKLRDVG